MAVDTDSPDFDAPDEALGPENGGPHDAGGRRHRREEALARIEASRSEQGGVDSALYWSILPVLIFWGTRQVASSQLAIGLGFAAAVIVFWLNRRRKKGVIAWLALAGLVIVSGSAIAGLILDSEKAYLSSDPIGDGITVLVALGSVALGRPIMGMVVCEVFPRFSSHLQAVDRVFVIVTLLLAAKDLTTGIARIFLLDGLDTDGYLIFSRVVSWPVNAVYFYIAYRLIDRANRDAIRESVRHQAA
ncbi:MAG TPA: hypothetical protein QGF05_09465 [Dehalococcoidia bacterium]|nr:hypothetical protein [Dehalococcoidia bacterium]